MTTITAAALEKRNFSTPDEKRTFEKGILELISLGRVSFGRAIFQPGWKWSTSVKPIVKTNSCEVEHLQYIVSGRLHVVMDDGIENELKPGDVALIPSGHDAWVVGNEPFVAIDVGGLENYAKRK